MRAELAAMTFFAFLVETCDGVLDVVDASDGHVLAAQPGGEILLLYVEVPKDIEEVDVFALFREPSCDAIRGVIRVSAHEKGASVGRN